jgi:hypothetical protein
LFEHRKNCQNTFNPVNNIKVYMSDNSANLNQIVVIDGKEYQLTGKVDFSDLKIVKKAGDIPDPDIDPTPTPTPDPTKPTEGTIKPGGWGANLVDKKAWNVVNMRNPPEQFKIVDGAGKNVATNFKTKEVAENFKSYFQNNPFPPEDTVPTPTPTPEPTPTPTPEPEPGPQPTAGTDKNGVQLLISDGKEIEYTVKNNFRDDGKRFDVKVGDWTQSEATGYFRFTKDPVDDECSIKWSVVPHSGKNQVRCYDSGVSIKNGKARLRWENPHPEYSGSLGTGQGSPLGTKWIGYKGTKTVNSDGTVTIKLYQDTGDNETKPSNQWKEIFSHTDKKYKETGPHPHVTLRIDDPKKQGQKNLEAKWISVAKI